MVLECLGRDHTVSDLRTGVATTTKTILATDVEHWSNFYNYFTSCSHRFCGEQCPASGTAETVAEIHQNVSTILQDVVQRYCNPLGSTPENPGSSCAEIAKKKPKSASGNYYVLSSTGSAVQVFCGMGGAIPDGLGVTKGWVRVANLDMTDTNQQCPDGLQLHTNPVRACAKSTNGDGCDSLTFDTNDIQYQQVCGRVRGYQLNTLDGFYINYGSCRHPCNDINKAYVDGISITYGSPRQHIWSFAGGNLETPNIHSCPCTGTGGAPPSFVGSDYYCESAATPNRDNDLLWGGQGCNGSEDTCCDPPNLPWFCKELPRPTTSDLEVRLCTDEESHNENILVEQLELYVQ